MDALYKLKDLLTDELEEYGRKGELSTGSLEVIDKLSHALKSISTVIAMEDGGYSGTYRDHGSSYARRRDSMGRYSSRYNRRYSEAVDDMVGRLRALMDEAPSDEVRSEISKLVTKVEHM